MGSADRSQNFLFIKKVDLLSGVNLRGGIYPIGRILSVLAAVYVFYILFQYKDKLTPVSFSPGLFGASVLFMVYFGVGYLILPYVWKLILSGSGLSIRYLDAVGIIGRTQIAKYLPGNIFHFINRTALANTYQISSEATVLSMAVETSTVVVAAIMLTAIGIWLNVLPPALLVNYIISGNGYYILFIIGIGLAGILVLLLVGNIQTYIDKLRPYINLRVYVIAVILVSSHLFISGPVIYRLTGQYIGEAPTVTWYSISFGFTVAFFLGFIVPGASGGIGIREVVFISLFGDSFGKGYAAGIIVFIRMLTILTDLFVYFLFLWITRGERQRAVP
jgi:hypothetical protein